MAGAGGHGAVLYHHAHIPAGLFQLLDGLAMGPAPLGAVHKEHVGGFGAEGLHALKVGLDIVAGVVDVAGKDVQQLIHPLLALGLVGPDEGVHGQHVHAVVMAQGGLLVHPIPPPLVVHDVVAAHQACQAEGLAGGVEGGGPLPGVRAHGLGGGVLVAVHHQIGPDLIGDHVHVVSFEQLHGLLQLPPFPGPAAGVMGVAQDGGVNVLRLELLLHVRKVHAPHALFILNEGAVNQVVAVVGQGHGEADVGGGMDQHLVAPGADHVQRRDNAPQDAVLIADVLLMKARNAVAGLLPADDALEILLPRGEVAKAGVLRPLDDGLLHRGHHGEVHVRHPHGDGVKAFPGGVRGKARHGPQGVHGQGILPPPVNDGGKVVGHVEKVLLYT